jgi:hypothetical protein
MQEIVIIMNEVLMEKGMKIKVYKTKVLVFGRDERMTMCKIFKKYDWFKSDRLRNEGIREECGEKEDVVTKIETNMYVELV